MKLPHTNMKIRKHSAHASSSDHQTDMSTLHLENGYELNASMKLTTNGERFNDCCTRLLAILGCMMRQKHWEPSPRRNVAKSAEVIKARVPKIFRILDSPLWDILFLSTCLGSVYFFVFIEGFLYDIKFYSALLHALNSLYVILLLLHWVQVILRTSYGRHEVSKVDVVFSLLSVLPTDLIALIISSLESDNTTGMSKDQIVVSISRLHYFFRIGNVLNYLSSCENQLILGDFYGFLYRILLYLTFLIHTFACIWHRIACASFRQKHFEMIPQLAREELCRNNSWIMLLSEKARISQSTNASLTPFLQGSDSDRSVLWDHYMVSLYWSASTAFRLGYGDLDINVASDAEIIFTSLAQIISWIFVLAVVSGTLTSLLIESDTERESYLTRRFAIRHYLNFSRVGRRVANEVKKFYDYLWSKRKGVSELQLIEFMPSAMKSEIFFDIHKFVLEQMPLFRDLDASFLMTLSIRMTHSFHLSGEILYRKNDRGDHMYYVLKGHLDIMNSTETHPIACIKSGSAIGDIFLVHPYLHGCTVRCGSECDILALTRESVNDVLRNYSQYTEVLQNRIQERFEHSVEILNLAAKCDKVRKYQAILRPQVPLAEVFDDQLSLYSGDSNWRGSDKLDTKAAYVKDVKDGDADSLSLTSSIIRRLSTMYMSIRRKKDKKAEKRRKSVEDEAYAAFAAEINRTSVLSKELGFHRAPLFVAPPVFYPTRTKDMSKSKSKAGDTESIVIKLLRMPILAGQERSNWQMLWKLFVSICTCFVLFYYTYRFAFRSKIPSDNLRIDLAMHVLDVIFCVDCFHDMFQIVVTPQKTLETFQDILAYRLCSPVFYVRLLAFMPIEYMLAPIFSIHVAGSSYFYLLKSNRLLEFVVVARFFQDLEGVTKIPIMIVFLTKFLIALMYVIHIFAGLYHFIWVDWFPHTRHVLYSTLDLLNEPEGRAYEFVMYWSTQIVTTAGFGDVTYHYKEEVILFCLGFIVGTVVTTYMGARVAAILANAQRRRVTFKQTYYGVTSFLKQRKFPDDLSQRIKSYYQMQWRAHEGVLIPKERSAIWDAPDAINTDVSRAQGLKFISRVPLLRFCPDTVLTSICLALKQYFVPPDECVLFERDKRRELYIIVKGFVKVMSGKKVIGHMTEGNYFGLNGIVLGENQKYKVVTETHCLFFCLQYEDFLHITRQHKCLRKDFKILRREVEFAVTGGGKNTLKNYLLGHSHENERRQAVVHIDSQYLLSLQPGTFPGVLVKAAKSHVSNFLRMLLLPWTFLPSGMLMTIWIIVRVLIGVLVSHYVLAHMALALNPEEAFYTMLIFDIFGFLDMYIMLHVAYYSTKHQLVTDESKTSLNYLKGPFILDFITCFPVDLLYSLAVPEIRIFSSPFTYAGHYRIVSWLRVNRCIQLYKLVQLGGRLNQTIFRSLSFITLMEVMPWMLVFIHILACSSVYLVCDVSENGDNFTCTPNAWITNGTMYTAIKQDGPDLTNPFKLYLISLYWVIAVALRVGFGDIAVSDFRNRMICMFVIISGTIVTTYLSSKLTACMVGEDSRRIEIRTKIDIMNSMVDKFKTSRAVKRRVREIYYNEWEKTRGITADQLFVALHPSLKADVMCHLYEDSIRQSPLLKNLDEPGIRMLASILKEVFVVEGEFVFKYGNITDDVYLIATGIVAAYNAKGDVMAYMGGGSLIGEMSAMYGITRLYTAVAATDVDLLVFSAEDFLEFLDLYPDLKESLEQLCEALGSEAVTKSPLDPGRKSHGSSLPPPHIFASSHSENIALKPGNELVDSLVQYPGLSPHNFYSVLDPLRVPLKRSQLKDKHNELMFEDTGASKKWWSVFLTFGRVPKTEMGILLHIFQDKKRCNLFNFAIHPASPIIRSSGWCVFNLLVTAISCALTSYEISFASTGGEDWPILVLRYSAEVFFVIRIIGNFHLAYADDTGVLVADVKKISKRYCSRLDGFVLDFITTVPFYAISYFVGGLKQDIYAANIRGIQLLRVILFMRYLGETDTDLRMKTSEVQILKITVLLCFIFHFCACAWYLVACYGINCAENSWMDVLLHKLQQQNLITDKLSVSISSRYWISLAYVTTTVTATGMNYVTPRTTTELATTIMFIFATVFVIGFLLGEMTQCLASQIARKIHYEHELSVIQTHLAGLGLNKSKRDTVAEYYKLVWRRFRGMPYYTLLRELPYPIRADIAFEIYGPNIRNARVLGKIDDQVLRQITARIQHEYYLPGGHIVRGGNACDAMYFIKSGEVLIIDENIGMELCVESLFENDCFGEVKILLPREPFRFSYVARVETEVGMLHREDLEDVLRNFPVLHHDLMTKAMGIKSHRGGIKMAEKSAENPVLAPPPTTIGASSSQPHHDPTDILSPTNMTSDDMTRASIVSIEAMPQTSFNQIPTRFLPEAQDSRSTPALLPSLPSIASLPSLKIVTKQSSLVTGKAGKQNSDTAFKTKKLSTVPRRSRKQVSLPRRKPPPVTAPARRTGARTLGGEPNRRPPQIPGKKGLLERILERITRGRARRK